MVRGHALEPLLLVLVPLSLEHDHLLLHGDGRLLRAAVERARRRLSCALSANHIVYLYLAHHRTQVAL